ncbi:hypothetical protein GCM10010124_04660 [Pilimelia terevasa]|uniref:Superoxide dismutase copper/zinc binding domain-containing protein n=1 Tax=Pilimelia terevasa TaxID=53372 RepID=A0A8J3BE36_9ACTN|nr:superoxide dismutase family protein [Pilimelia terevasa]GGK15154.1 hypothetical protein GCM10010124_04660 [Pilimelia terevasa]
MRRTAALSLLLLPALAGCTSDKPAEEAPSEPTPSASVAPISVSGTLAAYAPGVTAITYDPALAPVGATMKIDMAPAGAGLSVSLTAGGLKPTRAYGAHVHAMPCGAKATDSGPHLQHTPDPAASASPPSVDPNYANPGNEVWLDLTTDATGTGTGASTTPWRFTDAPRSVVLHAEATKTEPGKAGTAGARIACLSLPADGAASATPLTPPPTATATATATATP